LDLTLRRDRDGSASNSVSRVGNTIINQNIEVSTGSMSLTNKISKSFFNNTTI